MTPAECAARLNARVGAEVWAEGLAENPRWVFMIESDGISVGVLDLYSRDAELVLAAPHRLILTAVMQNGLPWVSARFVDFSGRYGDAIHHSGGEGVVGFSAPLSRTWGSLSVAHTTVRDDFGPAFR